MRLSQLKKFRDTIQKKLDNSRTFLEMLNREHNENMDLFFDNELTDLIFETEMVNNHYFDNNYPYFKNNFKLMIDETQDLIKSLEELIDSLNFTIQYEILKK